MGREVALAFAKEGATAVFLGDLNQSGLEETMAVIKERWPDVRVEAMQINVAEPGDVQDFISQAVSKFGRIDYAVNAAGIAPAAAPISQTPSTSLARTVGVNTKGVFLP